MGMNDFMALCSDVETDDGEKEKLSPWPKFMVEEVWADRVKFRRILKEGIPRYRKLNEDFLDEMMDWWVNLDTRTRKRCFMMPKEELIMQFDNTFDFKTAYRVVLCSVVEQVQHFDATGYRADGATDGEIVLEGVLMKKKGAWTVDPDYYDTEEGCQFFFDMMRQLGGDHLMPKRPQELREESEQAKAMAENQAGSDEEGDVNEQTQTTQTFRGDRRLVRLLIFRYFADQAWRKFERFRKEKENQIGNAEVKNAEELSQKMSSVQIDETNQGNQVEPSSQVS